MSRFQQSGLGALSKGTALGAEVSARGGGAAGKPMQEGWRWAPVVVGRTCQAIKHAELSLGEVSSLGQDWRAFLPLVCVCGGTPENLVCSPASLIRPGTIPPTPATILKQMYIETLLSLEILILSRSPSM